MSVPGLGVGAPEVERYDDGVSGSDVGGDGDGGISSPLPKLYR